MPLSKRQLIQRMARHSVEEGRILIEPLLINVDESDDAASIDCHLGERFVFLRRGRSGVHDPLREGSRAEAFGTEVVIPRGGELLLHPGQLVLARTLEWYCLPNDVMAYVHGRSIWGRRGLLVVTAAAVQPLTSATITLELSNVGEVAIIVRPGIAVGQLFFDEVAATDASQAPHSPPFTVTHRPIFGRYKLSEVERMIIGWAGEEEETRDDSIRAR